MNYIGFWNLATESIKISIAVIPTFANIAIIVIIAIIAIIAIIVSAELTGRLKTTCYMRTTTPGQTEAPPNDLIALGLNSLCWTYLPGLWSVIYELWAGFKTDARECKVKFVLPDFG